MKRVDIEIKIQDLSKFYFFLKKNENSTPGDWGGGWRDIKVRSTCHAQLLNICYPFKTAITEFPVTSVY